MALVLPKSILDTDLYKVHPNFLGNGALINIFPSVDNAASCPATFS